MNVLMYKKIFFCVEMSNQYNHIYLLFCFNTSDKHYCSCIQNILTLTLYNNYSTINKNLILTLYDILQKNSNFVRYTKKIITLYEYTIKIQTLYATLTILTLYDILTIVTLYDKQ